MTLSTKPLSTSNPSCVCTSSVVVRGESLLDKVTISEGDVFTVGCINQRYVLLHNMNHELRISHDLFHLRFRRIEHAKVHS